MITKHTPGPWIVSTVSYRDSFIINAPCIEGMAEVYGRNFYDKTAEANAHLIAAAPELLMVLRYLLEELEDEVLQTSINDTIKKAKAVIAKATNQIANGKI